MITTRIGHGGDLGGIHHLAWRVIQRLRGKPVETGARVPVFVATDPQFDRVSGQYLSTGLVAIKPSRLAQDDAAAQRLWAMSAALVGLPP
jgi:hypothetical protein